MLPYHDTRPEPPAWSPLRVVLITALVLTLGFGGAVFGIHVANINSASPAPTSSPEPSPSDPEPTPEPSSSPSPTPSPTPEPSPDQSEVDVPNLLGMDFRDARQAVRELDLDWRLTFGGIGDDATVVATWPLPGSAVQPGDQVRIFVVGTAPLVEAPDILGADCEDATAAIIEAGLYPRYQTDIRHGEVTEVEERADLRWNDELALTCTDG